MAERVAVVGAGIMGLNHARTLRSEHEPRLVLGAVIDTDQTRAQRIADEHGDESTIVRNSIEGIDGGVVDAAIISSPSPFHAEHAVTLLEGGVHTLIEKPVATTEEEAHRINEAARRNNLVAMVGHVEVFNPTVRALREAIGGRAIKSIELQRLSEVTDISRLYDNVVNDLAVHDLSIARYLIGEDELQVASAWGDRGGQGAPDPAIAHLESTGGVVVHMHQSRRHKGGKVRSVDVTTDEGVFRADLLTRAVMHERVVESVLDANGDYRERRESTVWQPSGSRQPLAMEQAFFLRACRGEVDPGDEQVSVEDALKVMRVTKEILRLIDR